MLDSGLFSDFVICVNSSGGEDYCEFPVCCFVVETCFAGIDENSTQTRNLLVNLIMRICFLGNKKVCKINF